MKLSLIFAAGLALAALLVSGGAASAQGQDGDPYREWEFIELRWGDRNDVVTADAQTGGLVDERQVFGPAAFDFDGDGDGLATGRVFSTASGGRYGVWAQAPTVSGLAPRTPYGGHTLLRQFQSYRRAADQAALRITIKEALMRAIDSGGDFLRGCSNPQGDCHAQHAVVSFVARAYSRDDTFFHAHGTAYIGGRGGDWDMAAVTVDDSYVPVWNDVRLAGHQQEGEGRWELDPDFDGTGSGASASARLTRERRLRVPLASIDPGEEFAVGVELAAYAADYRGTETAAFAGIEDPQRFDRALVDASGLTPLGRPTFDEPPLHPPAAAECDHGADPEAGTLGLSEPAYVTPEVSSDGPFVLVTRTGGSAGAASATIATTAGSAEAGVDYGAVSKTVRFEDGDTSPRLVPIPIIDDEAFEGPESFDVSLSDTRCAALGEQTTGTVTISDADDEQVEVPPSFTVGGTVSGLEGSGLVLSNRGEQVAIAANGPFQFPNRVVDELPYDVLVATHPSNPAQTCTVANGSGTIAGAEVTDIQVECATPPPSSGLDSTFDGDGKVSGAAGEGEAVAVQPDDSIVTAGHNASDFVLTRHDANGVPDPGFGDRGDGMITTDFGTDDDEAYDVAIQPDGKIIAVGRADNDPTGVDFAVARYHQNGTLDPSFGGDGTVTTDFGEDIDGDGQPESAADYATGVVVQPDGKLLAAGSTTTATRLGHDVALARYNADGSLDDGSSSDATPLDSFGGDGRVTTNVPGAAHDEANAVALQDDGRIVVAGKLDFGNDAALIRYESDGGLDAGFGDQGMVVSDRFTSESFNGVAITPDGRIVVAGYASERFPAVADFMVARYNADGSLENGSTDDSTPLDIFGSGGITTTDTSPGQERPEDFGADLAVQADGKIVVVGRNTSDTLNDMAVVRYDQDGSLDPGFGDRGDGIVTVDFHGAGEFGQDVAVQANGKIVAAGRTTNGITDQFALIRINP